MRTIWAALCLFPSVALAQGWPAVNSPIPAGRQAISVLGYVAGNAELKGVGGSDHPAGVTRLGFTAPGDGGAATYFWSPANCASADDGAQVQPTGITGCWQADFSFFKPNVKQWGAKGDGTTDDANAINTALSSANSLSLGEMNFPATSAFYGICSAHINYAPSKAFHVRAPKGTRIQVLPACASPPNEVWYTNVLIPLGSNIYLGNNVIEGLTLDGYCKTKYVLHHATGQGTTYYNMLIRSAAPGNVIAGSAGAYFANGNERRMGAGNVIANENRLGNICYTSSASLPTYGMRDEGGNDDFTGLLVVNAQIGIYNNGGDNFYGPGTHVWGGLDIDGSGQGVYNPVLDVTTGIHLVSNGSVIGAEIDQAKSYAVLLDGGAEGSLGGMVAVGVNCRYAAGGPSASQYCVHRTATPTQYYVAGTNSPQHTGTASSAIYGGVHFTSPHQFDGLALQNSTNAVAALSAQDTGGDNGTLVLNKAGVTGFRWQADGTAIVKNLPTSCSGKPSGTVWLNAGAMSVCP
jgi:hypothetical protein